MRAFTAWRISEVKLRKLGLVTTVAIVVAHTAGVASAGPTDPYNTDLPPTLGGTLDAYAGQNFLSVHRTNYWESSNYINDMTTVDWFGYDPEGEVIDEIVVTARRYVRNPLELFVQLEWGDLFGEERCVHYTDGGHCLSWRPTLNENFPLDPSCQTVEGQEGPISQARADELNLARRRQQWFASGTMALSAGVAAAYFTAGTSLVVQLASAGTVGLGSMVATFPTPEDTPFAAGQTITYSLTACNNDNGRIDADFGLTISD